MSEEKQLLDEVLTLCSEFGLLAFHSGDSRRDTSPGFPDLVICGNKGVFFRELKADNTELDSAQKIWRYRLIAAGADYGVWHPLDLLQGSIRKELKHISGYAIQKQESTGFGVHYRQVA